MAERSVTAATENPQLPVAAYSDATLFEADHNEVGALPDAD
ncbi:hypothetical protein [Candidatus Dactylopiibacterium carminicum]|nr:hypothetical protein [Candidatus Dactylopiibacterium carminicum]